MEGNQHCVLHVVNIQKTYDLICAVAITEEGFLLE